MSLSLQVDSQGDLDDANKSAGRWTQEEHNLFLQGLQQHQKQWKLIADMVKTRTVVQIRTHAQKYFQKLNKTSGWKFDKTDEPSSPFSEHDIGGQARTYAYPSASSRANSFGSGDSVDSHGTSAEGVDSDGEGTHRLGGATIVKSRSIPSMRTSSFAFDTNINASSGSTSCTSSTMSSPTGSGSNVFALSANMKQRAGAPVNVSKVRSGGGELVRKRSRDSVKSLVPSEFKASSAPSPKKSNLHESSLFAASFKGKDLDGRPVAGMNGHMGYVPNVYHASSSYPPHVGYGVGGMMMPGPLSGLPADGPGLSLEHVQDYFFPEDLPTCVPPYNSYNNRSVSNESDRSNPQYYYPHMSVHPAGGVVGGGPLLGPEDDGLLSLLDTIDWDMEPSTSASTGAESTSANSRPISPFTDTASSVSSCPSSAVGLRSPNPAAAAAVASTMPSAVGIATVGCAMRDDSLPGSIAPAESTNTATVDAQPAVDTAPSQHRMAFSNVIDALKLMKEVVTSSVVGGAAQQSADPDHITLFNLFHRDGAEAVGRLPPLRSLMQEHSSTAIAPAVTRPNHHQEKAETSTISSVAVPLVSTTAAPAHSLEFDDHDFDFAHLMNDEFHYEPGSGFDSQAMDIQFPNSGGPMSENAAASVEPAQQAADAHADVSRNFFDGNATIMDSNGSLNAGALLNGSMQPRVATVAGSKNGNPTVAQRKRGRPRKHSISVPNAPASTPSSATAKSLLSGPALSNPLNLHQQLQQQHQFRGFPAFDASLGYGFGASTAQPIAMAFSAPSGSFLASAMSSSAAGAGSGGGTGEFGQVGRSYSGDATYSTQRHSPFDPTAAAFHSSSASASSPYFAAPDIRSGLTRTMSTESDTMLAATFDPKLYDALDYGYGGMGMLEDFE